MLRPLADKILVKPGEAEETTKGGIVLPDTAKKKPREGEVLAVGPGKLLDSGQRVPPEVKVGEVVVYSEFGGTEITVGGEEYVILDESSVLAVRATTPCEAGYEAPRSREKTEVSRAKKVA